MKKYIGQDIVQNITMYVKTIKGAALDKVILFDKDGFSHFICYETLLANYTLLLHPVGELVND